MFLKKYIEAALQEHAWFTVQMCHRSTLPYGECFKSGLNDSDILDHSIQESDCSLLYLMDEMRAAFGFEKAEDILLDIILSKAFIQGELTEVDVKEHIENDFSITLPRTNMTRIKGNDERVRGKQILGLYAMFHPVYIATGEDRNNTKGFSQMKLQTLETYQAKSDIPSIQNYIKEELLINKVVKILNTMGPLIQTVTRKYMTTLNYEYRAIGLENYKHLEKLEDVLAKIWMENAKSYLRVDSFQEVIVLLKAFHASKSPMFKLQLFEGPYMNSYVYDPCNIHGQYSLKNYSLNVCKHDQLTKNDDCAEYCQIINRFSDVQYMEKVKSFLEMGYEELNPEFGAFKYCGHAKDSGDTCWKKVITEKGICFSTRMGRCKECTHALKGMG